MKIVVQHFVEAADEEEIANIKSCLNSIRLLVQIVYLIEYLFF